MAEFQEVCRQALRMGEALMAERGGKLEYFEMCISKDGKTALKDGGTGATAEEIEKHVMQWAAKHPEPRYPSWNDAWKQLFPDACSAPCPNVYFGQLSCTGKCDDCRGTPILADIAEKLGVKPIGGDADA